MKKLTTMKGLIDSSPPYLLSSMAGICLLLAIALTWQGRLKPASLLSALFLVLVLLAYFPQLDSLKAFTVDVKLRHTLDRADEILDRLRKLSVVNARLGYTTLAWGNRLGAPKATEKQKLLDDFDEQLVLLKVSAEERQEIKRPYVRFIAFDFASLFIQTIDYALNRRQEALSRKLQGEANDHNLAAVRKFSELQSKWRAQYLARSIDATPLDGFRAYLQDRVPVDAFSESETAKLRKLAGDIADLFEASRKKGGYTDEAAAFYDKYTESSGAALAMQIIGDAKL